jgi:DNA-directed RNA polymerase specialized sigma24 family protein
MNFNLTTPEINTSDSTTAPRLDTSAGPDDLTPVNDNHTRGGIADTTPLIAHPAVVRYIRATLRRFRVPSLLMDDAIADVQTDSIEAARMGRMPSDLAQWKALVAKIATRWALDRRRKANARAKVDAGLCDDPDAYERPTLHWERRDPVDTKKYLAVIDELFESGQMPECGADILCDEADQVPHAEIAAEVGVSQTTVDNRLSRMRRTFRARLKALGLLAILLLMVVLELPAGVVSRPAPESHAAEPVPSARCMPGSDAGAPSGSEKSTSSVRENRALCD